MSKPDSKFLEQTVDFWQSRYRKELSLEDGRNIMANMTEFADVLAQWDQESQSGSQTKETL